MGTSGPTSDVTREDAQLVFAQFQKPGTPLTTTEVAEELECSTQTAHRILEALVESDALQTRQLDGGNWIWWQPAEGSRSSDRQSELEEFGAFVSAVEDYAIFMLDPDGTIASWNEGAGRIKGYAEDDIVGEHVSTFYTDDDVDAGVPQRNLEIAAEEGRVEDEGWRIRADGTRFWADVVITAIRDDDGTLQGFTKVTRDMTEQREYEQQLGRERDLIERIFETIPVSIYTLDADGNFARSNQRGLERLGLEADDLSDYGVESYDVFDADGEPIPTDELPWTRVAESREPVYDYECQIDLPDRGRRWLSVNVASIEDGHDERIVLSMDDITDQKERERRLRREYDQTEKLLRTAPIAIAVQNTEGDTVMANQRAQETLGLPRNDSDGDPWDTDEWDIYDANGDPLDSTQMPAARVLATGEPVYNEELIFDSPTGERIRFHLNAAPLFGPDETIERVVTAGEDITELKRRERQLEQRKTELETELSEILGRISDAFYAVDDEWRFTHLNEQAAGILQRSRDELLGREVWEVVPDASADVYREQFETAMRTQDSVSFEIREEAIDAWLEFNAYPSESGVSVYFRNITERKQREDELERVLDLLDKTERIADVGGWEINMETMDVFWTDHIFDLLEVSSDEEPSLDEALELYHEDDEQMVRTAIETALDSGDPFDVEARIRTGSGEMRWLRLQGISETADEGHVLLRGAAQDVTERKRREQRLEDLIGRLETSNERLEQFAYAASHDLQEPLRMVSSYLQLIEARYGDELDADGQEFIEFAVDGADRMRNMIDALLEYSRVETQGDPPEPVDLNEVISGVREDLRMQIEESDADISVEPLPRVEGDPSQLRQVFQNLLDNAIEYSVDEPPRIHVAAERTGSMWKLSVRDEGIGIDPDQADRIFEVFQRLHSREEHDGTGIGLALCRRVIERHGGDIWVDSEPGEGATFSFTLPAIGGSDA